MTDPARGHSAATLYEASPDGHACEDLSKISIPFLVKTAETVLRRSGIRRFHLVGHSMGGLTALLLAHQDPGRVLSFTDIEGNIAPEDCFLSRQVLTHPSDDAESFFDDFIDRTRRAPFYSSALYAASLRHKVRPGAVRGIFESMVHLSDHGDLMSKFLALPCPRMFMYGEQNSSLSYLTKLSAKGVELAEIPHSAHWPMYSNPMAMWQRIADFCSRGKPDRPKARQVGQGRPTSTPVCHRGRGRSQPALNGGAHASAACSSPVAPVQRVRDQAQQPRLIPAAMPHATHN